jgi:hypothetical protein
MVRLNPSSGEVEVVTETVRWSGKPLGYDVSVVLPVSGSDDAIVLLKPDASLGSSFRNLLRLSAGGAVRWRAELPERGTRVHLSVLPPERGADFYLSVAWGPGDQLLALSWSSYSVRVDPDDGRIMDAIFTK